MSGLWHGSRTGAAGAGRPDQAGRRSRGRRSKLRRLALALPLALMLSGLASSTAWAEEPSFTATFTCSSVTYTFTGFPNAPNNTVTEAVFSEKTKIASAMFSFDGPTGTNTVTFAELSPGHHSIDANAKWNTNGVKGGKDVPLKNGINCPEPKPAFTIEKLQMIAGSGGPFTTATLEGEVGQTVNYEIIVTNTGNTTLTFSNFTDTECENIAGGPGVSAVGPGESTTFTCEHVLNAADQAAGKHENNATVTGTPPPGQGGAITHTSNTVLVTLKARNGAEPLTPGYWKNHLTEGSPNTAELLPQSIGNYEVATTEQASEIFAAMNCGTSTAQSAIGCLAGHLLATELNLANGADTCIAGEVSIANEWLKGTTEEGVPGVVYTGPSSTYTLTEEQRKFAIKLKSALAKYNNGRGC